MNNLLNGKEQSASEKKLYGEIKDVKAGGYGLAFEARWKG